MSEIIPDPQEVTAPIIAETKTQLSGNGWWDRNIDSDLSNAIVGFKLTLSGREFFRDWRLDAHIDYDLLEDDITKMPSIFGFWSAVLAEAKKKLGFSEYELAIKRAKILDRISKDASIGVKMTKDDKDNIVTLDKDYAIMKMKHIELECTISKLYGIVDSMRMKSDQIRTLAGFKRAEMQGS